MERQKYFFRIVPFSMEDGKVSLVDIYNPEERSEIDPWLGTVVSLADGQHTVQELIDYLGGQYREGPPARFEETVESVLKRLIDGEVVRLSDEVIQLPPYLAAPYETQDAEEMKRLMIADGYIQH